MADAARVLSDLPAEKRPDLIDINMGCPVRKVVNRCSGAALLQDVPRIERIVRSMSDATDLPVTAKIRLGWDGSSRNVVEVARALEARHARRLDEHAAELAEHEAADMAIDARPGKAGYGVVVDGDGARDAVRDTPEAGAQHEGRLRRKAAGPAADRRGGIMRCRRCHSCRLRPSGANAIA